jgi:hypothetical protein
VTGANDGITECAFCIRSGEECFSDEAQLGGVLNVVAGLVSFEASGEFVGVVEDFLCGSGHGGHLRYLGRAGIAWMMIGPSLVSTTPISSRLLAGSAPMNIVNPSSRSSTEIGWLKAWIMSVSGMPCLRALGAMSGASTATS